MTNTISPLSSASSGSTVGTLTSNATTSSTAEILSSFKEILSMMTAANSASSLGQSSNMGMNLGDLMAPLMLLMIERLVEQQLDQAPSATGAEQASAAAPVQASSATTGGSKPEPSGLPLTGRLTQGFHAGHKALDIAVPGGTPVKTTMDGKVIHAGWNDQGYGNLVIIENGAYRTYYAHLSSIPVSVGDQVTAGTTIGLSGNTGHSTGPHLHYEIRKNKVAIDPTAVTLGAGA